MLSRGLAELCDQLLVIVRMNFEQMAGGRRGTEPGLVDGPGGTPVHRGAGGGRDGAVDGGGDERVHEFQRVEAADDTGVTQASRAVGRLGRAHPGQGRGELLGDLGAQDGGCPREAVGVGTQAFEAGDETAATGRRSELAQQPGGLLHRRQLAVLRLGDELDHLVGVAAGDGPHLAAERVVRVVAQARADQLGGGVGGEGAQRHADLSRMSGGTA
ncbi:hypothetical protein EES45_03355 [Streptomyces sp. ADI97-07]|nr:hypothetical protein EES45_03355 [Streptomyces sp. ADI97-07]